MRFESVLPAMLAILLLGACSNSSDSSLPARAARPALHLIFSDPPIDLGSIEAKFARDVPYGPHERNVFDIFVPACDAPTPLILFFHGGGFTGGNKAQYNEQQIREALQHCVAWATIGYRLLPPRPKAPKPTSAIGGGVRVSLGDSALALQFIRYHHQSLNLAQENIAAWGRSAGAGTALWLGTHDDLANADSDDPVRRESTRLKAVGAIATQATYDILRWEQVFEPLIEPLVPTVVPTADLQTVAETLGATGYMLRFLGASNFEDILTEAYTAYRTDIDMLALMDAGDPPIYVANAATSLSNLQGFFLHHALHAIAVKARADEVGLTSVVYSTDPDWPLQDPSGEELTSFLLRHIR
ncbi:MAG: carboxylesterase family protein [Halioglobus sp.]|nr:carboxylesterase family protein [Halioglobus sp.]